MEPPVSSSVAPKHIPSLTGTFGKEAVLPVEGELRRSWEAEAPSTSSQRAPEGNDGTRSTMGGLGRRMEMPVPEAIQKVASYQMWMPLKGKTELRQEADVGVSSFPEDLRVSPVAEARLPLLRRVRDGLAHFLCCFYQAPSHRSGLQSSWDLSVSTPLKFSRPHKKIAHSERHHWPEDQVSLYSCTIEVIEKVVHLYKWEIKDAPQSKQVQRVTSDDFQAMCAHVVWDLLKTRVVQFLVETPTTITNAWASHSIVPVIKSVEGSKHLSEAASDICKSLLAYLVTPDAAISSVLSEALTSGEERFYLPLDLYLTVQSNLQDFVANLNRSEITSFPGPDQVNEISIGEEGHRDGRAHPGNISGPFITSRWSETALELDWKWNSVVEDPSGPERTHSEGSLEKMVWAYIPFIQPCFRVGSEDENADSHPSVDSVKPLHPGFGFMDDPGLGISQEFPTSPSRADSALVLETSESHHCSTSPAKDIRSARPVPAAAKKKKLPTFRFGRKLNKVQPLDNISEEHQSSSSGNAQEILISHGESEASASTFKKLRKRLSKIFRAVTKA